jgi:DNA-binding protein YbaB
MECQTLTIKPEAYNNRDIDMLSDMICEILAEEYGVVVDSLSFSIEVSFTSMEDEE